jgi:hypothetical protein
MSEVVDKAVAAAKQEKSSTTAAATTQDAAGNLAKPKVEEKKKVTGFYKDLLKGSRTAKTGGEAGEPQKKPTAPKISGGQ